MGWGLTTFRNMNKKPAAIAVRRNICLDQLACFFVENQLSRTMALMNKKKTVNNLAVFKVFAYRF
jgi:hypothetical protein